MSFIKINQPLSFKDQAYIEIKKAIIEHKVIPGSMLYERSLSESLGISRTPLKLALQQLEIEGWVQSIPRKGIFVQSINKTDVDEVFQMRKANEVLAIELLIPLLTDKTIEQIEKMDQALFELKEDRIQFMYADSSFHLLLAKLSENQRLYQLIQNLIDHVNWYGLFALKAGMDIINVSSEHKSIIDGLKTRNLQQAKDAVIEHLNHTHRIIIENLEK